MEWLQGTFGFSYIGFLYLCILFLPNLLWMKHPPQDYDAETENPWLVGMERIGQALVCTIVLIFQDFNLHGWSVWSYWLLASMVCMLLYVYWWYRYFHDPSQAMFYSSLFHIPVAGATLPVLAFFLLGIYGKVIWLLLAVSLLGIGHIGIHLQHASKLHKRG